jgi:hypothetical protein
LIHGIHQDNPSQPHSHDEINNRKRSGSSSVDRQSRKIRLIASGPRRIAVNRPRNGLPTDIVVIQLRKIRDTCGGKKKKSYSAFANGLGQAMKFIPAVAEAVKNAFLIAKGNDLHRFIQTFDWKGHGQLSITSFTNHVDIEWEKNLKHVRISAQNLTATSVDHKFLEYQQRWRVEAEIERRVSGDTSEKTAARRVFQDVVNALRLCPSNAAAAAKKKTRASLTRLFIVDERHYAFLCWRPVSDKWRQSFRNDFGGILDSHIKDWSDLAGEACDHIWKTQTILQRKAPG